MFCQRLKEIRIKRGFSQTELAKIIGQHVTAVNHWEQGTRTPNIPNLKVLCDALNISSDYLIGNEIKEEHQCF